MSNQLATQFSFPLELVSGAVAFPTGHYVEVDDDLFTNNGLGRKIVQTQQIRVHGRDVSLGYINEEGTQYSLILGVENPVPLGAFDDVARANHEIFNALHVAFGGKIGSYAHHEMVMAIMRAKSQGVVPSDTVAVRQAAGWARTAYKRAAWIFTHTMDAAIETPVDWTAKGL